MARHQNVDEETIQTKRQRYNLAEERKNKYFGIR